jgi:hypothetical protein
MHVQWESGSVRLRRFEVRSCRLVETGWLKLADHLFDAVITRDGNVIVSSCGERFQSYLTLLEPGNASDSRPMAFTIS